MEMNKIAAKYLPDVEMYSFEYHVLGIAVRDHPFSTYAKIFRETNISYSLIRTRTCVYQGVRNR